MSDADDSQYLSWAVASITDADGNEVGGTVSFDTNLLTYTPTAAEAWKTVTIVVQPSLGFVTDEISPITFEITVNEAEIPQEKVYFISKEITGSGLVWSSRIQATADEKIQLFIQPAAGYVLDSLEVVLGDVQISDDYTFIMPASNVRIKAVFVATVPGCSDCPRDEICPSGHTQIPALRPGTTMVSTTVWKLVS